MSSFRHSRLLPASPEAVYSAIRDPERLARWWGPDGFTNTFHTFEFREGGAWLFTMHGPDGKDYPNRSAFLELVPGSLVRLRHVSLPRYELSLTLRAVPGGTRITWVGAFENEAFAEKARAFLETANEQNLDRLERELRVGARETTGRDRGTRTGSRAKSVDRDDPAVSAYIAAFAPDVRAVLERIRRTARAAAPSAQELVSYRMPALRQGGILIYFAAFKSHIGVFPPVSGDAELEKDLAPYAGPKGNLRFPLDRPIPYGLIARIVRLRVEQNAVRAAARKGAPAATRQRQARRGPRRTRP